MPLIEELLFRGLFLRGFPSHYGPRQAIVISALLWALGHEPWQAPVIFVVGLALGWLYHRTGSLTLGLFAHVLNNAFCTLEHRLGFYDSAFQPLWLVVVGGTACAAGLWLIIAQFGPEGSTAEAKSETLEATA